MWNLLNRDLLADLNHFDPGIRSDALDQVEKALKEGTLHPDPAGKRYYNLHCHSFFSYSGYGFSPSALAVLAKLSGWLAVGMVDFDVLDGVEEFLSACARFDVPAVAGIETRVFVPELANVEINSPGEVGIAYHLGFGFTTSRLPEAQGRFVTSLKENARKRILFQVEQLNKVLSPVEIDPDKTAARYTPNRNLTERHLCRAYREQAETLYKRDSDQQTGFWSERLNLPKEKVSLILKDPVSMEGAIRSALLKSGGVGYIPPTPEAFPTLKNMNGFLLDSGAEPVIAWLNGMSAGEFSPDALLRLHEAYGAKAVNLIPDRNYHAKDPARKKQLMDAMAQLVISARAHNMPLIAGTELNAPGQKLVDDFLCPELEPYWKDFLDGAYHFCG